MKDRRNEILARLLIDYSIALKKGDILYFETKGRESLALAKEIIRIATERGATPFWFYNDESLLRNFVGKASAGQMQQLADLHLDIMKKADAYIGLRGSDNPFDMADIDSSVMEQFNKLFMHPVHLEQRVKRTRWVVLRYPNNAMAQLAETSQESFENFYYDVCCADYPRMSRAMDKLIDIISATDRVHIKAPGTDLRFSLKGIPVVKCDGKRNIPDGEVYTAPVRDSIEGTITYNTPSLYQGTVFNGISLTFSRGKIVESTAGNNADKVEKIFNTDEGARYVGEFAIGLNPFILKPMKDTLFDEKIAGSFHLTPGQCYDEAPNGNKSAIHWDLVQIQRPDYGGGEIWFDGRLFRKDGKFVDDEIENLFSKENLRSNELDK